MILHLAFVEKDLHVVDIKRGVNKMRLLKGMNVYYGIAFVGNGQIIVGEQKKTKMEFSHMGFT